MWFRTRMIDRRKVWLILIDLFQVLITLVIFLYYKNLTYFWMSIIAIGEWIINVVLLNILCRLPIVSIPNMFSFFSLIFHCGQFIKAGFIIEGNVPLPFQNYADSNVIGRAFYFYLFSSLVFFVVVGISLKISTDEFIVPTRWLNRENANTFLYGKVLLVIGIIPRVYIDIISIIGALRGGYEGVYSIYIPQVVQSIAFFADAGLFFLLFGMDTIGKRRTLFVLVLLYKCLIMTSGGRQDKVAFLLVWIYVYFFIIQSITIKKALALFILILAGFLFISAIGITRSESSYGLSQILNTFTSGETKHVVGNSLGEFGSALVTLEAAIRYTPSNLSYGLGRTYITGMISIIPLLVNQIPLFSKTTIFVEQLPENVRFAFGGSFLGELYYNFGWFGIIGSGFVAWYIAKLHEGIIDSSRNHTIYTCWCSIVSTAMIMYVRGYFTDMMQRLVWTYFAIYGVSQIVKQKSMSRMVE